jgi:nucleotide-binding universal stress UspA family protein
MQTIGEIDASKRIIKEGDIVEAIQEEIDRIGIDILVIGHDFRTFSFFKEDYVTRYLKDPACPVLVIPLAVD